jgi:hypothetical protein
MTNDTPVNGSLLVEKKENGKVIKGFANQGSACSGLFKAAFFAYGFMAAFFCFLFGFSTLTTMKDPAPL